MPTSIRVGTDLNALKSISSLCTIVSKEKSPETIHKNFLYQKQYLSNMLQRAYNMEREKYDGLALLVRHTKDGIDELAITVEGV